MDGGAMVIDPLTVLAPHCDIVERLAAIPPEAEVRGVWFRALDAEIARRGLLGAFDEAFPRRTESSFRFYPVGTYLIRAAYAGALVASPAHVHEGLGELFRSNAKHFPKTLFGRALIRVLAHDPVGIARQSAAAKRLATNYGRWTLLVHGPRSMEMVHDNEYVWIESALCGGVLGTMETCGLDARVEVRMRDRFNGSTIVTW
jgi:uncharacterized protein (TIGR02265 family)